MTNSKMHMNKIDVDQELVREVLAEQLTHWSGLPITSMPSLETVNAVDRFGDDMCIRLPRRWEWSNDFKKELRWLPTLAAQLSLSIPKPLLEDRPGASYPF